jgi:uncharacterized protein YjcR
MDVPHTDLEMLAELKRVRDDTASAYSSLLRTMYESGMYHSNQLAGVLGVTDASIRMMARRKGWQRNGDNRDHN